MRKKYLKGSIQICQKDRMVGKGIVLGLNKGIILGTKCISIFWNFGFDSFYLYKVGRF
jgi:hypothetical protein